MNYQIIHFIFIHFISQDIIGWTTFGSHVRQFILYFDLGFCCRLIIAGEIHLTKSLT